MSTIHEFINNLASIIPKLIYKQTFEQIANLNEQKLIEVLPSLLGWEIHNKICNHSIEHPIFVFDSYQQSQPYSESEEWLKHMIDKIGYGLFIITSREKIEWNKQISYSELLQYPEDDAKKLVTETIKNRPDLVDAIIDSTECIPIYINLALDVYEKEVNVTTEELIDKSLFSDRNKLVNNFINHLNTDYQQVVLDLACIKVFNKDVFVYLAQKRKINIATYEYDTIINTNLVGYVSKEKNSTLFKLHDVFCRDVQKSRKTSEFLSILESYLDYICFRRDYLLKIDNGITLSLLFRNLLELTIEIEKKLNKESVNWMLTISKNC